MRCLIGIDNVSLINIVQEYLKKIDTFSYIKATNNLETAQKLLLEYDFDFMIASCCQQQDQSQRLLGWIREKNINIEIIYATYHNDLENIQKAFRYGVCDYLILPLDFERFSLAIQRVIEKILFLNSQKQFSQKEVDDYIALSALTHIKKSTSSKGISESTLTKIENYIKNINTSFSAERLAEEIGLSRVTVRRYLENMADDGQLKTKLEYGKIGRPVKLYYKDNLQGEI
ncbi:MAG: response regulator [Eubacteriales bacterium]